MYSVPNTPRTTARMLPTNTAKKSSTRDAAAAQPIEPLHVKRDRHQHRDERQHVDVLLERRHALDWRDQLCDGPSNRSR